MPGTTIMDTRPSISSLKRAVETLYGLNVTRMTPFKTGVANANYTIQNPKKAFVLRVYLSRTAADVNAEVAFLEIAAKHRLPVPQPIKNSRDNAVTMINGRPTIIYPLLPGKPLARVTTPILKEIARFQGRLHRASQNKTLRFNKEKWEPKDILRMARENRRATSLVKELKSFRFPASLPYGLTHQDIKPENILVLNGHVSGIIDFDNCYDGALLHDVTTSILWLCQRDGRFDQKRIQDFLDAYSAERWLTSIEKKMFDAALRWRVLREVVIWDRIAAGILNPNTTPSQRKRARGLSDSLLKLYRSTRDNAQ